MTHLCTSEQERCIPFSLIFIIRPSRSYVHSYSFYSTEKNKERKERKMSDFNAIIIFYLQQCLLDRLDILSSYHFEAMVVFLHRPSYFTLILSWSTFNYYNKFASTIKKKRRKLTNTIIRRNRIQFHCFVLQIIFVWQKHISQMISFFVRLSCWTMRLIGF